MTESRQRLGRTGEALAAKMLEGSGYRILARRYRRYGAEIDLVCERGDRIVFVEVKARAGDGYGSPGAAVTPLKRRRMARAALTYLVRHGLMDRPCRFDVVEVVARREGGHRVRHIDDAFRLAPGDYPGA